jgi:hypothetical protein
LITTPGHMPGIAIILGTGAVLGTATSDAAR